MSDSAIAGSPGAGAVFPGSAASKPDRAAADDAPVDTEAYRRGDPASFASVLERYGPLIRRIVNSYSDDRFDQEDMYQEASIRLLTQAKNYREQGTLKGWVATLTRGVCRNWRTSRATRTAAIERYSGQFPPVEESQELFDDPSRLLRYRTFLERLESALAALPRRQATAWRLVHVEGHSVKQAAQTMNTTPGTVRSNIRHARVRLRELMEDARDALS